MVKNRGYRHLVATMTLLWFFSTPRGSGESQSGTMSPRERRAAAPSRVPGSPGRGAQLAEHHLSTGRLRVRFPV